MGGITHSAATSGQVRSYVYKHCLDVIYLMFLILQVEGMVPILSMISLISLSANFIQLVMQWYVRVEQ